MSGSARGGDFQAPAKALARFAAEHGAKIALEPLNPILMNADTFICSLPDALSIVQEADEPNFGLWVDVWHVFQDAAAREHIAACAGKIFGVYVNDWPTPRCFGDRLGSGDGEIAPQLPGLLRAVTEAGYAGAYTLEIFSESHLPNSLWNGDLEAVITRSRAAFAAAWQAAWEHQE